MKRWLCKLQAYVQIYKATGAYAILEGALQIKNCRKYAQQARKCIFLYQSARYPPQGAGTLKRLRYPQIITNPTDVLCPPVFTRLSALFLI